MKSIKEHVGFVVGDGHNEHTAGAIKKIVGAEGSWNQTNLDESRISRYIDNIWRCRRQKLLQCVWAQQLCRRIRVIRWLWHSKS